MFPENKTGKCFFHFPPSRNSTYRNSICRVTAWPFMRSKNCSSFFFQEGTSRKFLILLLSYFPVFWLQISSAFAFLFADCHGLSCVHVRDSSYTALFRVPLSGVGPRCLGLAQKISAHCNPQTDHGLVHVTENVPHISTPWAHLANSIHWLQ